MEEKTAAGLLGFIAGMVVTAIVAYAGMTLGWPESLKSCLQEAKRLDMATSARAS